MPNPVGEGEQRPCPSVLLVDDDADIRLLWRLVLERDDRFGLITEAASAETALARIAEDCPDVVLTDLRLGPMSGFELLTATLQHHREVVVVVTSGVEDAEAQALHLGAADFITKERSASTQLADTLDRAHRRRSRSHNVSAHLTRRRD